MTDLTYALTSGAVLRVTRPRPEFVGGSTEVSYYATSGELPGALRDELDVGIPVEFGGPDSALDRIVRDILGSRHDVTGIVHAPLAARGESQMEVLQRAVDDDRRDNDNH